MGYKWKPSASQRKDFAEKMKDPDERIAYYERKLAKKQYDNWKDKDFVPTKEQHDFCFNHMDLFKTVEETNAANIVMGGYITQEKVNHYFIHIVNEKRREFSNMIKENLFRKLVRKTLAENYPAGAELSSDAPWNQNTQYTKPKQTEVNEFSVESVDATNETAILKNNNDESSWIFSYADIDKSAFEPYAEQEKKYSGQGEEGTPEFEYGDFEINTNIIDAYVNDNLENISIGAGQDDFESGKQLVKMDNSMQI